MVLCLILSLIAVSLESARWTVSEVQAERLLSNSMKSVLAEYYKPLYDEYHIFALDGGFSDRNFHGAVIEEKTEGWIRTSLAGNNPWVLCDLSLNKVGLTDKTTLLSDNGNVFRKQAVSYQKYRNAALLAQEFFSMAGLMEQTEAIEKIVNSQMETEEVLAGIDEGVQKLMEYIDGVQFKDGKIKRSFIKKVVTANEFAKQLLTLPPSQESTGINNKKLYQSLKNKYVNVSEEVAFMETNGKVYLQSLKLGEALWPEVLNLQKQIDFLNEKLQRTLYEEDREVIKGEIKGLEEEISFVQRDMENASGSCSIALQNYNNSQEKLQRVMKNSLSKGNSAIEYIHELRQMQKSAETDVRNFQAELEQEKEMLSETLYEDLKKETEWMEGYTTEDSSSLCINLKETEETLSKQKEVLEKLIGFEFPSLPVQDSEEEAFCSALNSFLDSFDSYPSGQPVFDYQDLKMDGEDGGFFDSLNTLMKSGIMDLVLDSEKISANVLPQSDLPSAWYGSSLKSGISVKELLKLIENSSVGSLFSSGSIDIKKEMQEDMQSILDKILYISYIEDNFSDYETGSTRGVLQYESEYMLFGNLKDEDNLSSIIFRIFLIRFMFNFIHVMTDSVCKQQAAVAAAAAVGFLGFTALISLAKYLILIVWAMEAALVEVSAIMQGKRVNLFVTDQTFCVSFGEVLSMTGGYIKAKAESIRDGKLGVGYQDYLRLFLFCKPKDDLCYYTMDIIQENIRAGYDENFYIKNCVTAYLAEAEFVLPKRFLLLPGAAEKILIRKDPFRYNVYREISY